MEDSIIQKESMLKDRTAIVTGAAGKGMGRSIALTLARAGANVVVNYLTSAQNAQAVVAHIEKQGGRALAFQADITHGPHRRARTSRDFRSARIFCQIRCVA